MHDERLVGEFGHQAESFNRSQAANAPETLAALVELADPRPGERWLEAACGPGGAVVLADHLLDEDPEAAAWSAEIERLRDPSHWASLPLERLRALGAGAGLERGSVTAGARPLLERLMAAPPAGARRFTIRDGTVLMTWWAGRFRRPGGPSRG